MADRRARSTGFQWHRDAMLRGRYLKFLICALGYRDGRWLASQVEAGCRTTAHLARITPILTRDAIVATTRHGDRCRR